MVLTLVILIVSLARRLEEKGMVGGGGGLRGGEKMALYSIKQQDLLLF